MKRKILVLNLLIPFFLVGCGGGGETGLSVSSSASQASSSSAESASSQSSIQSSSAASSSQSSSSSSASSSASQSSSASSSQEEQIPNFVLHGQFGGATEWTNKQMQANPHASGEYMILSVGLCQNDVFRIHLDTSTLYGHSALKTSIPAGLVGEGNEGAIKVLQNGLYDIYCAKTKTDGGNIYLSRVGDYDPTVVPVTGIKLNRTGICLWGNKMVRLEATILPSNATNQEYTLTVENPKRAVVVNGWVAKGETAGKTKIVASSKDGSKKAECMVYVGDADVPPFSLFGTIGGQAIAMGDDTYGAINDTGSKYIIPDVSLSAGDEIKVYNTSTGKAVEKYSGVPYAFEISEAVEANLFFDVLAKSLTIVKK